ncbi:MAG: class I SAM-dependent methyltransferase [Chloroflexi bacterium]|nr:class I SAM-dependent methyltransferase [Chloroflexota bacterium]
MTTTLGCRSCGSTNLLPIVSFGDTPLADRLLTEDLLDKPELLANLELVFCPDCTLVQITESVSPDILFGEDYPYFSSVSPVLLAHFRGSALDIIERRGLDSSSWVVEAASNDGYMLKNFMERGITVLGIDPAAPPAKAAQAAGVPTLMTYFTVDLARQLVAERGRRADVFLANNVLAHVPDLNGFVEGIRTLLAEDGVAVIEVPYLIDLIDHREFDTIYHQHLCYFSVTALDNLFRRHNLYLDDVKRLQIHGGSLRLFVEQREAVSETVQSLLRMEKDRQTDHYAYYTNFADSINRFRDELMALLGKLKSEGKTIVGYGAAAKATTMLAYTGIDLRQLDYVVDLNPFKQGRFMPGTHLPIHAPQRLLEDKPDFVLVLAWNFADEIIAQQDMYRKSGGQFIVPLPKLTVV